MESVPYTYSDTEYIYGATEPVGLEQGCIDSSDPFFYPDWGIQSHNPDALCALCGLPNSTCIHSPATTNVYGAIHQDGFSTSSVSDPSHSACMFDTWPSGDGFDEPAQPIYTAILGRPPDASQALIRDGLLDDCVPQPGATEADITSQNATVCKQCGMAFHGRYQQGNLVRHNRQKHAAPALKCEVFGCFKDFARMDKLKDHVRNAHKGDVNVDDSGRLTFEGCESSRRRVRPGSYTCPDPSCLKSFDRSCELNRHQKTHLSRSERPHRCSVCNEGFLYPKDLARHGRKHAAIKETKVYYCPVPGCPNAEGFSRRDNLLRHQRREHSTVISG